MADCVIVDTADAVLVADKNMVQDVKKVVEKLKNSGREEYKIHRKVYRPWGSYDFVHGGHGFKIKHITVNPGQILSLQMHRHRAEHWIVVRGTARVTRGEETFVVSENQSTYIPRNVRHRLENRGTVPLELIEAQSGSIWARMTSSDSRMLTVVQARTVMRLEGRFDAAAHWSFRPQADRRG